MDDIQHEDDDNTLGRPAGLTMSPTGDRVAYYIPSRARTSRTRSSGWTYKGSIWVADVGRPNSARRLTDGTADERNPQWSSNGSFLVYMSDREQPGKRYDLYRFWFGVDALPARIQTPWRYTHFVLVPTYEGPVPDRAIVVHQYGLSGWDQRFANCRWLDSWGIYNMAIGASGFVTAIAKRGDGKGDRRVAMLTRPGYEPASAHSRSRIWMGGESSRPFTICVEGRSSHESFPFAVVDLAWAGKTLYILSGNPPGQLPEDSPEDSARGKDRHNGNPSTPFRPCVYRLDDQGNNQFTCTKVYGDRAGDGFVVGIGHAGDDLLVHTREDDRKDRDETWDKETVDQLHLLLSGQVLWRQKTWIHEAVATKTQREGRDVYVVAVVSDDGSPGGSQCHSLGVGQEREITEQSARQTQISDHVLLDAEPQEPDEATQELRQRFPLPLTNEDQRWMRCYCPYPTESELVDQKERKACFDRRWHRRT